MSQEHTLTAMQLARKAMTDTSFRQSSSVLAEERARLREQIQMKTAPEIAGVINKLRADHEITPADLDLVRLWLIGDAEGYLQMENNLQRWLAEYDALHTTLARFTAESVSIADMVKLQGLMEEGVRLCADIANLLEKKERVANFENATRDAHSLNKEVLASVLSRKLESDQS